MQARSSLEGSRGASGRGGQDPGRTGKSGGLTCALGHVDYAGAGASDASHTWIWGWLAGRTGGSQPDERSTRGPIASANLREGCHERGGGARGRNRWQSRMPLVEEENQGKGVMVERDARKASGQGCEVVRRSRILVWPGNGIDFVAGSVPQ